MRIDRLFELAYMGTEVLVKHCMDKSFDNAINDDDRRSAMINLAQATNEQEEIMKLMIENGFDIPGPYSKGCE